MTLIACNIIQILVLTKVLGGKVATTPAIQTVHLVQKMGQNDFNSVLRPPIKILSTLFTLKILILLTMSLFYGQKS